MCGVFSDTMRMWMCGVFSDTMWMWMCGVLRRLYNSLKWFSTSPLSLLSITESLLLKTERFSLISAVQFSKTDSFSLIPALNLSSRITTELVCGVGGSASRITLLKAALSSTGPSWALMDKALSISASVCVFQWVLWHLLNDVWPGPIPPMHVVYLEDY